MFSIKRLRKIYKDKPSRYKNICYMLSKVSGLIYIACIVFLLSISILFFSYLYVSEFSITRFIILGLALIATIISLFNIMFIKNLRIKGLYLKEDYKRIWEIVNNLTKDFNGVKINNIVIIDKCRVNIVTQYKFGIWGKRNNSLLIGLPILLGFSEKELETLIAYNICKSSKRISRKSRSIRNTYLKLKNIFDEEKSIVKKNFIFKVFLSPFLKLFYNYYKKAAYIAIKEISLECDKVFLENYEENTLCNNILKKYVHSYLVESIFMKKLEKEILETGNPSKKAFSYMNEYLNENISGRDIVEAIRIIKSYDKEDIEYIASPLQRVENMNYNIDEFQYEFGDNSSRILGSNFEKILNKFNNIWFKESEKEWNSISEEVLKEKAYYERLCRDFSTYNLDEKDYKKYLNLREKYSGVNTAIIEGKKLCIASPYNGEIRYLVGKLLLMGNNSQGIEYVENGVKIDPFTSVEGYTDIINYYTRKEDYEKVTEYERLYKVTSETCKNGLKEREKPKLKSLNYEKIDLSRDTLVDIKNILEKEKIVKNAYISKLKLNVYKEIPHYILWIDYKLNFFTMEETLRKKDEEIKSHIFIDNITVIHLNGDNFWKKIPLQRIKKYKIIRSR